MTFMSEETDAIRQDIAMVRESMTDKIEQIESKVRGTVDTTVEQVNRLFDLRQQVHDRPWAALSVAALVGFAAGSMGGSSSSSHANDASYAYGSRTYARPAAYGARPDTAYRAHQSNDMTNKLGDQFGNELRLITAATLAAGVNMLRDTIKQSVPNFDQEYAKVREGEHTQERAVGAPAVEDRESIQRTTAVDPNIPLRNYEQSRSS
jgi:ElaB/YqjD/DUF883 family membrane-anchored ribosome-binding protein